MYGSWKILSSTGLEIVVLLFDEMTFGPNDDKCQLWCDHSEYMYLYASFQMNK